MPRTVLPDARRSPRFSGIATFMRYPRLADVLPENLPLDWAIYGVPFDSGVTYRPGARFGPRSIRDESQYIKRFHLGHNVDVCDCLSIADAGDAPVSPFSIASTLDLIDDFTSELGDPVRTRLMAVGGDHSIAYANIRAAFSRAGEPRGGLALVHFDSHLDTVDVVWGERFSHASPFRRAIEEGLVDPKRMLSIGIKGPLNSVEDLSYARGAGVTILTPDDLMRTPTIGPGATERTPYGLRLSEIGAFVRRVADAPAYVTFDVDVVDPAFAPGTGTPSIGGLTSAQALELIRELRGINLVGADVVEVLPDRDVSGITALLAAQVMFELLALDAIRRR